MTAPSELDRLQILEIKLFALESVILHLVAPILLTMPSDALELIRAMPHELRVNAAPGRDHAKLVCEECIADIADKLEGRIRSKLSAK